MHINILFACVTILIVYTNATFVHKINVKPREYGCRNSYSGYTCLDCNTKALCSKGKINDHWPCSTEEDTKEKKGLFCDLKTTSCVKHNTCDISYLGKTMTCEFQGKFPNPVDCHSYFYCEEHSARFKQLARKVDCPENKKYSITQEICADNVTQNDQWCTACNNTSAYKIDIPNILKNDTITQTLDFNHGYYVLCPHKERKGIELQSCANRYETYNIDKNECEFKCPKNGTYQHAYARQYYSCKSGKWTIENCDPGYEFLPALGSCVLEDIVQTSSTLRTRTHHTTSTSSSEEDDSSYDSTESWEDPENDYNSA